MQMRTVLLVLAAVAVFLLAMVMLQPRKGLIDPWQADSIALAHYSAKDDASHPSSDPGFFEWWYYDAQSEECSVAVAIHATNVSNPGSNVPNIEVNVACPNATAHIVKEYDRSSFSSSNETCDVSIGGSHAEGNLSNYDLLVDEGGVKMDLHFDSTVPSWRPGSGTIYFGADKTKQFSWLVAVPRATVNGTLTINGTSFNMSGTGYHDHNWGNIQLFTEIKEWYWGRVYSRNLTLIYADILLDGKYNQTAVSPVMLATGDGIVMDGNGFTLMPAAFVPDDLTGNKYPSRIALDFDGRPVTGHIDMDVVRVTDRRDLLEGRSGIERFLINQFIGHPAYYRFLSHAVGNLTINGAEYQIDENVISEQIKMR
jgi:predicted secreted hydrolase